MTPGRGVDVHTITHPKDPLRQFITGLLPKIASQHARRPVPMLLLNADAARVTDASLDAWIKRFVQADKPVYCAGVLSTQQPLRKLRRWWHVHVTLRGVLGSAHAPDKPLPAGVACSGTSDVLARVLPRLEAASKQTPMTLAAAEAALCAEGLAWCDPKPCVACPLVQGTVTAQHWDALVQPPPRGAPLHVMRRTWTALRHSPDGKGVLVTSGVLVTLLLCVFVLACVLAGVKARVSSASHASSM